MWNISLFDVAKLMLEFFLGRINQQFGVFAEDYFSDLDEASHLRLADLVRIKFIDLVVIMELNAKSRFF
jgi:hypothetical protein